MVFNYLLFKGSFGTITATLLSLERIYNYALILMKHLAQHGIIVFDTYIIDYTSLLFYANVKSLIIYTKNYHFLKRR